MIIAHIGIGLLILGITGSSTWQKEKITKMKIGDETKIEKYNIVFKKKLMKSEVQIMLLCEEIFLVYDEKKKHYHKTKT